MPPPSVPCMADCGGRRELFEAQPNAKDGARKRRAPRRVGFLRRRTLALTCGGVGVEAVLPPDMISSVMSRPPWLGSRILIWKSESSGALAQEQQRGGRGGGRCWASGRSSSPEQQGAAGREPLRWHRGQDLTAAADRQSRDAFSLPSLPETRGTDRQNRLLWHKLFTALRSLK